MKRGWNLRLWAGFLVIVAALLSYVPFFARIPVTRDFPWANLLMFVAGALLMSADVKRAFRQPGLYRGKILGCILGALGAMAFALFAYGIFHVARQLPPSKGAPKVGEKAPDFTLPDINGKPVTLAELLAAPLPAPGSAKPRGVLLIFYRGYW